MASPGLASDVFRRVNPHPHDTLIRAIFGQPDHAADELRAILPASLTSRLDLAALARVEASFVDPALRATSADLLFTVPWHGGGEGFVYFLLEHQSSFDRRMPIRLLRYMTRIWERHAADTGAPPIVPVVLYQGVRPWTGSRRFADHLAIDATVRPMLAPYQVDFEFLVDDLAAQSDVQLLARAMGAIGKLALIALKNARPRPLLARRFAAVLRELRDDLRGPGVVPALAQLVSYVLEAGEGASADVRAMLGQALAPEVRSDVMVSTADLLRAEGRTEGQLEARRESLTELLEARFGAIKPSHRRAIASASLEQLIAWIRRGAVVPTAAELFRK